MHQQKKYTKKYLNSLLKREELSDKILMDLTPTNNSIDDIWLQESERRLKEYRDRKVEAISGEQVFKNMQKRFGM